MNVFLAGSFVSLTIPLQDRNGNAYSATAVEYRVVGNDGSELLPKTVVSPFVSGSNAVTIGVSPSLNSVTPIDSLAIGPDKAGAVSVREIRTIELYLTVGLNTVMIVAWYALEPTNVLIAGLNSFQAYSHADALAFDIPGLNGWQSATEAERISALVDAHLGICQLRFSIFDHRPGGALALMTPIQYEALPISFKAALCKAQVAEADSLLGGNPVDIRRKEGLMLESIGEVKQMFRPGKPLDLPVSKRALKYLSPFVTFAKHIGRG